MARSPETARSPERYKCYWKKSPRSNFRRHLAPEACRWRMSRRSLALSACNLGNPSYSLRNRTAVVISAPSVAHSYQSVALPGPLATATDRLAPAVTVVPPLAPFTLIDG